MGQFDEDENADVGEGKDRAPEREKPKTVMIVISGMLHQFDQVTDFYASGGGTLTFTFVSAESSERRRATFESWDGYTISDERREHSRRDRVDAVDRRKYGEDGTLSRELLADLIVGRAELR